MKKAQHCIPTSGEILRTVMGWLDVPKETADYNYQHLKRLAEGRNMSQQMREQKTREVVDAIASQFSKREERGTTRKVEEDVQSDPLKYLSWQLTPEGGLRDLCDHLVADLLEFLKRHEALITHFTAGEANSDMLWIWTKRFVVPFLAVNDFEYRHNCSGLFRGMPPFSFWYLPALTCSPNLPSWSEKEQLDWLEDAPGGAAPTMEIIDWSSRDLAVQLPVQMVLEWWQDLLGISQDLLAEKLCSIGPGQSKETAQRELKAWLHEDRPPAAVTVERWCTQEWEYKGALQIPCGLDLEKQWKLCREFLTKKGLNVNRLEDEIGEFPKVPLQAFFDSQSPVRDGLPVAELVRRIVERYSPPNAQELKVRLMWAAAFQRAFRAAKAVFGSERAWKLVAWYRTLGGTLINVQNYSGDRVGLAIRSFISDLSADQRYLREALEPLFGSDQQWREMICSAMGSDWLRTRVAAAPETSKEGG
jgi:hypothetical protein